MDDTFKIFVHRLKDGHREIIKENLAPDFMAIDESDLSFIAPIHLEGTAEVVQQMLVLTLKIETEATLPCAICNQDVQVPIQISNFFYSKSLDDIKSGIFNYQDVIREALLIELPYRAECEGGDCPERAALAKYLSQPKHEEN